MEKKDVEKAKEIIKQFDPALLMRAMQEIDTKVEEEKAKDGIRKVYESIPDAKKRGEILSKAVAELEMELIDKEVMNVRASIEKIDKEVLQEAAKDYFEAIDVKEGCICINPEFCYYPLYCEGYHIHCNGYHIYCRSREECRISLCGYSICGYSICGYRICGHHLFEQCKSIGMIPDIPDIPVDWWKKVITEGAIKEILESPELPKAMEKMIKEMKMKGEL